MSSSLLTSVQVKEIFREEVENRHGQIKEIVHCGDQFFARALLPLSEDVCANDSFQAGVALRKTNTEVSVHPFMQRQVCSNGMVMSSVLQSFMTDGKWSVSALDIRMAITAACKPEVFTTNLVPVRHSQTRNIDKGLRRISQMVGSYGVSQRLTSMIIHLLFDRDARTEYDLMNAITFTAHQADPKQRWILQQLGGGIGARLIPLQPEKSATINLWQKQSAYA